MEVSKRAKNKQKILQELQSRNSQRAQSVPEQQMEQVLLNLGVPFKAEYQVDFWFIDFAIPDLMIGIEVDGAQYHNSEKDRLRDIKLKKRGWTIHRIPAGTVLYTDYVYNFVREIVYNQCQKSVQKNIEQVYDPIIERYCDDCAIIYSFESFCNCDII